jgi:hypothetical protein
MKILLIALLVLIIGGLFAVFLARQRATTYRNPIDSKAYVAEWRSYQPESPRAEGQTRTMVDHIRLLNEQALYERDIGIQPLAEFSKKIEAVVREVGDTSAAHYELLIEVKVSRGLPPTFQMATQGEVRQEELQAVYAKLAKLPDLRSSEADLTFQMHFKVSGQGERMP